MNEEPNYNSSKVWVFLSEHCSLYLAFVCATSVSKYARIGLFYLCEIATFKMNLHMLIVKLHHSSCFFCNLMENTLLTKDNSMCFCTI